jgi:hypothetical protein
LEELQMASFSQQGRPGSEIFRGAIDPDGSALIVQTGFAGPNDPFRRPLNTEFNNWYLVSFDASRAKGVRHDRSSCYVNFSKR